jgi:hypothetical protein
MIEPQELRAIVAAWWEDTFVNDYVIDRSGNYRNAEDCIEDIVIRARAALAQPAPETLPPGYIDPEHSGADRKLLEVFYAACNSEGGTADEIHLRGIRAVLAAQPEPEGPSKAELRQIFDDQSGFINDEQVMWWSDFQPAARAVLARWGNL